MKATRKHSKTAAPSPTHGLDALLFAIQVHALSARERRNLLRVMKFMKKHPRAITRRDVATLARAAQSREPRALTRWLSEKRPKGGAA